jgi:hypothetical protein
MIAKKRDPNPDDQERINYAVDLMYDFIEKNEQVEPSIWISCIIYIFVNSHKRSDVTYEEFKIEMGKMVKHFEGKWDER